MQATTHNNDDDNNNDNNDSTVPLIDGGFAVPHIYHPPYQMKLTMCNINNSNL